MNALSNVANSLFDLVLDLDPARTTWARLTSPERTAAPTADARTRVMNLMQDLARSIDEIGDSEPARAVRDILLAIRQSLSELAEALEHSANAERWRKLYARLARHYDELVRAVSKARLIDRAKLRRLAPRNYLRNGFHVVGGVFAMLFFHYFLDVQTARWVIGGCALLFSLVELSRRFSPGFNDFLMRTPFLKKIARAHEYYRVNSSTYYAWGMLIAALVAPPVGIEAACLVLAVGDPAASNVGRRYGRIKLFRDKSIAGTSAFILASFVAVFVWQCIGWPEVALSTRLLLAATAAVVGGVAELLSTRLDDNLTVPASVGLGIAALYALL